MTALSGEFRRFRGRVLRHTVLAGLFAGVLLGVAVGPAPSLGFWLGAFISALSLHLHGADVQTQAGLAPSAAANRARLSSLGRTALRAAALAAAYLRPELSFGWTAAGLFTGHAVLVVHHMAHDP